VAEVDDPVPSEGHAIVQVLAAGLNPVDLTVAAGAFHTGRRVLPYVAGREGVGVLADGTPVYFDDSAEGFGALGERTAVPTARLYPLPAAVEPSEAICAGIAGWAAWLGLERGRLTAGETVLVLGATGVVGAIAVQVARSMGAGRVIAAGRDAGRLRELGALGVDETLVLGAADTPEQLARAAAAGLDVVLDLVWGEPARQALQASPAGTRLVQVGQSAGGEAALSSAVVRGRALEILGHSNLLVPHEVKARVQRSLLEDISRGRVTVPTSTRPLEELPQAWAEQRAGAHRKLILTVG